jgi:hypothetical protein
MFDDYVELDSGAAAELEAALQKRYTLSKRATAGGKAKSGVFQQILNVFRQQDGGQQQRCSDAEEGRPELQAPFGGPAPIADAEVSERVNETPKQEALRLLLCVDEGRAKPTLKQVVLQNIKDDCELFTCVRELHFMKRGWFTLRSVGAVSLTQVGFQGRTELRRY